jgi:hypothetical protein
MALFKILSNRWVIDDAALRIYRDEAVDGDPKVFANTNSTNELYSALQDRFDEPDMMDQLTPMSAQTPTEYTMTNGWFIDSRSTEFLYGGAIQSSGWASNVICAISYNATTPFADADIGRTITGTTTTDSGTILWFDDRYAQNDQGVVYIRPDDPATDLFDNDSEAYTVGGSSAAGAFTSTFNTGGARSGESLWPNPFTLGSLVSNTDLFFYQDGERVVSSDYNITTPLQWWGSGQLDILLQVRELGTLTDRGYVKVLARRGQSSYDFFQSDLSSGGRQPLPLSAATDLNDADGFRQMVFADSAGNWAVGDRIEDDTDTTIRGVITQVTGTNPTITVQYYLIGDPLNDFTGATGTLSNLDDTGTATAVAPTSVNGGVAGGITVTVGLTTEDINNGGGAAPYSVRVNPNSNVLGVVYQRLKYLLRRGETTDIDVTNYTGIAGEEYTGIELRVDHGAETGGTFTQGEVLSDATTGAEGKVVAVDSTNNYVMLGQVKGTFTNGNTIQNSGATVTATMSGVETVTPVKACAFGSLAGGVFFGARGVCLTTANLAGSDAQNYQLTDNGGTLQVPPNVVSVTVGSIVSRIEGSHTGATSGTVLQDSGATFQTNEADGEIAVGSLVYNITDGSVGTVVSIDSETQITTSTLTGGGSNNWVTGGADTYAITRGDAVLVARTSAGAIIRNALTSTTGNNAGDTDWVANASIPSDYPSAGVLRVVDVDVNEEHRYRYSSFTGSTFTLVTPTDGTGNPTTNDATNGAVVMIDSAADFEGAATPVAVGDQIRNATDGGVGTITAVFQDRVYHTPLAGGTNNDWETTDTYEINRLVATYVSGTDTAYVPIVDAVNITEGITELNNTLVFASPFDVTIRVRQGKVILPFISSGQVTSGGLTVSAIRTEDTIAT